MSRLFLCWLGQRAACLRRGLGLHTPAEREWLARLEVAIEALPEPTRSVFRMIRLGHVSYAETAEQLGISEREVDLHLAQALRILAAVPRTGRPP